MQPLQSETEPPTSIDVVIPVFNEERRLSSCIKTLSTCLQQNFLDGSWRILVAENGSTDRTGMLADSLTREYPWLKIFHIDRPGRGGALAYAYQRSQADIVAYMDVDLATDLEGLPLLVRKVVEGCDIAVGSRLLPASQVTRSLRRELISRAYNFITRRIFRVPFTDAQCGFKALRRAAVVPLLPRIKNTGWFFDTELLLQAYRSGFRIQEVPVRWTEDPDSRVKLASTILQMAWGLVRLKFRRGWKSPSRPPSAIWKPQTASESFTP